MNTTNVYSTRQTKKSLGITNIKGIAVRNLKTSDGFLVTYRAEAIQQGYRYTGRYTIDLNEATKEANAIYKQIFGSKKLATAAGYWNN